mmetsp:Transcript_141297/g.271066  ORF Transcript_141297/g.271066 Transcript_141297/m.271066 type:complete len:289 (+) Transcript_141297:935-1801(+)
MSALSAFNRNVWRTFSICIFFRIFSFSISISIACLRSSCSRFSASSLSAAAAFSISTRIWATFLSSSICLRSSSCFLCSSSCCLRSSSCLAFRASEAALSLSIRASCFASTFDFGSGFGFAFAFAFASAFSLGFVLALTLALAFSLAATFFFADALPFEVTGSSGLVAISSSPATGGSVPVVAAEAACGLLAAGATGALAKAVGVCERTSADTVRVDVPCSSVAEGLGEGPIASEITEADNEDDFSEGITTTPASETSEGMIEDASLGATLLGEESSDGTSSISIGSN